MSTDQVSVTRWRCRDEEARDDRQRVRERIRVRGLVELTGEHGSDRCDADGTAELLGDAEDPEAPPAISARTADRATFASGMMSSERPAPATTRPGTIDQGCGP
jgi:hypothetical protein